MNKTLNIRAHLPPLLAIMMFPATILLNVHATLAADMGEVVEAEALSGNFVGARVEHTLPDQTSSATQIVKRSNISLALAAPAATNEQSELGGPDLQNFTLPSPTVLAQGPWCPSGVKGDKVKVCFFDDPTNTRLRRTCLDPVGPPQCVVRNKCTLGPCPPSP